MLKPGKACYLLILLLWCCRKPYNPPAVASPGTYLVVEGVINSGPDSTIIKLSQTVPLNAQVTTNPLAGATVTVQNDQNASWPLTGDGLGNYVSAGLNLPATGNYRLFIITPDKKQYASAYQPIKPTPPIDSIGYTAGGSAANIYVNTHDPANNTHYYRWDYQEAWIFHAMEESSFVLDSATSTIVPRPTTNQIYYCYGTDASSTIDIASTAKLSKDLVYQSPITNIPFNSEKIEATYLIYLKQYALTADAYNFYLNLKTNTEQLGSIFDAQPSQLQGNIHNVANAAEPVIGWITVTNVQTKKTYFTNQIVPPYTPVNYPGDCPPDTAWYRNAQGQNTVYPLLITLPIVYQPVQPIYAGPTIIGFTYGSFLCTDCTIRGSVNPPWFWQ